MAAWVHCRKYSLSIPWQLNGQEGNLPVVRSEIVSQGGEDMNLLFNDFEGPNEEKMGTQQNKSFYSEIWRDTV